MKQFIRASLRQFGFELTRSAPSSTRLERRYVQGGRIPWSAGYGYAKEKFIRGVLADAHLLELFKNQHTLPMGFGISFDERCVEYPWLLSRLGYDSEIVLDAGSALNYSFILDQPTFEQKMLHILTLAPEQNCFWRRGVSYLYEDLRNIPLRDAYYDTVICLSTLEHVGCDNTMYTQRESDRECHSKDWIVAIKEMARVLKPGGRLFLTVPFGFYRHFGSFQQFDPAMLAAAVTAFGELAAFNQTFYRYTADGWNVATPTECARCEYVTWVAQVWSSAEWPEPLPCESDLAAAARAVACLALIKG